MATLEGWFDEWALTLRVRSGRADWPDAATESGREFWLDFRKAFARCGAFEVEADEASSVVCDIPDLYLSQFRPMVVEAVKRIQARNQAEVGAELISDPREAEKASRDCPDCAGNGFAVRYVHADIFGKVKTHGGHVAPIGSGVSYPCSCPLGRLVAAGLKPEGSTRDVLTIDQYPSLRMGVVRWSDVPDNKYRRRPSRWDDVLGCPIQAVDIRDLADLKRFCASLAGSFSVERALAQPIPREAHHGAAGGLPERPERPELAGVIDDPVVGRELARPTPRPATLTIPEDDAVDGWF